MAAPTIYCTITYVTDYGITPSPSTDVLEIITDRCLPDIECSGATFLGWYYSNGVQA